MYEAHVALGLDTGPTSAVCTVMPLSVRKVPRYSCSELVRSASGARTGEAVLLVAQHRHHPRTQVRQSAVNL